MDQTSMKTVAQRLISARSNILGTYPFFGKLLMRLPFGFAKCETAYTDMSKIIFDPEFAARLDDKQLCFVVLHELMHCVLKHCTRAKGKIQYLYNIACDIVVNSIILEAMNLKEIEIDGAQAMHLSPEGNEGRNYSAEELYEKLLKETDKQYIEKYGVSILDNHKVWGKLKNDPLVEEIWDTYVKKAAKGAGRNSGIPGSIERYVSAIRRTSRISWKQVLHDYLQNDRYDYMFSKPDTRYSGDFIMPSFQETEEGTKIDKVFFFIDTSGSVSNNAIAEAFEEIKDAISQIGNMTGMVMFFDAEVSPPTPFENVSDIEKMKPIGGGGTDFGEIFKFIHTRTEEDLPAIIIIMTDGYASFPDEKEAMDIPVIWLIIDSDVKSPWGECIHVYTDKNGTFI